ncbi:MAG: glycosyltransferase family 39 protein [bacterium]|nr:glycosyltransferase family 39 protein [bacterium]
MIKQKIANFWLYKQRYRLAYGFLILSFISILAFSIFVAPRGLTEAEISFSVASHNLEIENLFSSNIINLPFKILQKLSIGIFGLSEISVKLPAILLSFLAIFLIVKLSHAWFGRGIATITAILATASGQFFFISQSGTAEILQVIYPLALILLGFDFVRKRSRATLLAIAAILGLMIYSPLGIFMLVATTLALFAHPGLRLTLRKIARKDKILTGAVFLIVITPTLISIWRDGSTLGAIFGWAENFNFSKNFQLLFSRLFSFENAISGGVILPIVSLPTLILIAIGIFFTLQSRHTPKSYLLYIWLMILLVACMINPDFTVILFVPILLLTSTGIYSLIQTWYTIFPKNPYARVFGLIPISVFLGGFLLANLDNFRLNYLHSPEVSAKFNQDLHILQENLGDRKSVNLMISAQEKPFYKILEKQNKAKIVDNFRENEIFVSNKALKTTDTPKGYQISRILTSSKISDAARFYILKKL